MVDIQVRYAIKDDAEVCARLIYMTMGTMADYLMGNDETAEAINILEQLFRREKNRYSYQYTNLAIIDGEIAGLLLSYPGRILKLLDLPMMGSIIAVNELPEALRFFVRSIPLMMVKEVEVDEYFINNVAVLPNFRRRGVGKLLMNLAEKLAKESGLNKCALTVEINNEPAVKLYQQLGYQIVGTVKVEKLERMIGFEGLYRMVKVLAENSTSNTRN